MNAMIPATYDAQIIAAVNKHLMWEDWRRWKAQLFQESGLNPTVTNRASGCQGIAQFEPSTFIQCARELGYPPGASPFDPVCGIDAGAYYMAKMWRVWKAKRSNDDRRCLAQASYNAGEGVVIDAQKAAGGAVDYASIRPFLPDETKDYVDKIARWYAELTQ
jgi:soluble lytic murein transglycosylase-like protein